MENKIKIWLKSFFKRKYLNLESVKELNKRGIGVY